MATPYDMLTGGELAFVRQWLKPCPASVASKSMESRELSALQRCGTARHLEVRLWKLVSRFVGMASPRQIAERVAMRLDPIIEKGRDGARDRLKELWTHAELHEAASIGSDGCDDGSGLPCLYYGLFLDALHQVGDVELAVEALVLDWFYRGVHWLTMELPGNKRAVFVLIAALLCRHTTMWSTHVYDRHDPRSAYVVALLKDAGPLFKAREA